MLLRFDFVDGAGRPVQTTFDRPRQIIEAWSLDRVGPAMADVERAWAQGRYVAGFVSYEAAPAFDGALATQPPPAQPLLWFGVFDAPAAACDADGVRQAPLADVTWTPDTSQAAYDAAVARLHRAIVDGDAYQINYTFRLKGRIDTASIGDRYEALVRSQRPPYAAWLALDRWHVLSLSPELFFRLEDGLITTRPMKGTAPRGRFGDEDDRRAASLAASAKDRAENVMIVDLARNDVSRVAVVGTVRAASLFDVERYPGVLQMTSTVTGRVRPGTSIGDIFAALFPAGSITGAPKAASMRLIAGLETAPRGLYCGAIGFLSPGGRAVFNVAIRTATVDAATGVAEFGVGGGITWDSTAEDERLEAWSKASFMQVEPPFDLIETMRLEAGRFVRRDRHVRRMAASARHFDFTFVPERVNAALDAHAHQHAAGTHRARLLLARDGSLSVESVPFTRAMDEPLPRIALASSPVSSADRFLCHKTTNRAVYERHRAAHPDAFDVLLWNERGELTELTIGNVVLELDGERYTPPRSCGLLDGVFRDELLETGMIRERLLTRADLSRATRVWLINSLREWVQVRLPPAPC